MGHPEFSDLNAMTLSHRIQVTERDRIQKTDIQVTALTRPAKVALIMSIAI